MSGRAEVPEGSQVPERPSTPPTAPPTVPFHGMIWLDLVAGGGTVQTRQGSSWVERAARSVRSASVQQERPVLHLSPARAAFGLLPLLCGVVLHPLSFVTESDLMVGAQSRGTRPC